MPNLLALAVEHIDASHIVNIVQSHDLVRHHFNTKSLGEFGAHDAGIGQSMSIDLVEGDLDTIDLCTRQFFIYTSRISVYDDLPLDDRDGVGRP